MATKKQGNQTVALTNPPAILGYANAVGKKEGEGPLAATFDFIAQDDRFEQDSWEKAESMMQKKALSLALDKAKKQICELDWLFAGDLLNQCIASAYAAREQDIPFFGLYGACSTMGEGLNLAAMSIDGGFASAVGVVASSHFCSAERQYRTPLEYGGQRTPTAQWTATGAGAVILASEGAGPYITHITPGKVIDLGIKDTTNMGAAMAPAACATITAHLKDLNKQPSDYDLIVTGDLGVLGSELLLELMQREGYALSNHFDCGVQMYDIQRQDVHAGGSGCGCAASVLTGHLLGGMAQGQFKQILFCPTGALHSPVSAFQGESIPAICHAVSISTTK